MGVSDKKWFRFTCPTCGKTEVSSSSDHGSTWGPPSWSSVGAADFVLVMDTAPSPEPEVKSATCKKCKVEATVEEEYGFAQPKGW